jgi:FkbM family methyltransferase
MRKIIVKLKSFFHLPYTKTDHDFIKLEPLMRSASISDVLVDRLANEIRFTHKGKNKLAARLYPSSDLMVFKQVMLNGEYATVADFFKDNVKDGGQLKIIDAGANVGYTAVYFKEHFPAATIACIEPDENNRAALEKNAAPYIQDKTVLVYANALMGEANKNMVVNADFRDGRDWSKTTSETETETGLKSITIDEIMKANNWDVLDILKIDIEGAERFIFNEKTNLDFLNRVKVMALEIHDEFNIRQGIYNLLRKYNFIIANFGETTFCINKSYFTE